ncbi:MAG: hypothetical protein M1834_001783 [Cirrosporium novae-zelandiae]|nr:MAG: hypothetical protein M1834_001783 [Cirrosporium novae-zelandiae]
MVKVGKPKSKRTPVRLRHKIEKASAAKQRKEKKLAKKNPQWRTKLKKDPGIPNLFPYKDRILREIEEKKQLKEEDALRKKEETRARKQGATKVAENEDEVDEEQIPDVSDDGFSDVDDGAMDVENDDSNPMAALLASARARAAEYEAKDVDNEGNEEMEDVVTEVALKAPTDPSLRAYSKPLAHVIENSTILLHVLDARDPQSTFSNTLNHTIAASSSPKAQLLVLNKADLVPPEVLTRWLKHFQRTHPVVPLIASKPSPGAKTFAHRNLTSKSTIETLFKALKSYASNKNHVTPGASCTVGVVGYPNVGKSSVINALASKVGKASPNAPVCPIGAEAGITTAVREIKLDSKLKILDCPGTVFPSQNTNVKVDRERESARLTLLSALPPSSQLSNPQAAVSLLLSRLESSTSPSRLQNLLQHYGIPVITPSDPTSDFLVQVARKRGRLGKGGIPDLTAAAAVVVGDWRDGRVEGWVDPPARIEEAEKVQKQIVGGWAAEFKLEGLWGDGGEDEQGGEGMKE